MVKFKTIVILIALVCLDTSIYYYYDNITDNGFTVAYYLIGLLINTLAGMYLGSLHLKYLISK